MDLQHINIKIFADGGSDIDLERVVELFHEAVANQSMDELLIDVVDYRHVWAGPAVVLVGSEADYSMDGADERYGLRYNRKAPLEGTNQDRFLQAFQAAAKSCAQLETQVPGIQFSRREFEIVVNDRAIAPNTQATRDACDPELRAFVQQALGASDCELQYASDPRSLFGATLQLSQPWDLSRLALAG